MRHALALLLLTLIATAPIVAAQGTTYEISLEAGAAADAVGDTRTVPLVVRITANGLGCPEGGTYSVSLGGSGSLVNDTFAANVSWVPEPGQLTVPYAGLTGLAGTTVATSQANLRVRVEPAPFDGTLVRGNVTAILDQATCSSGFTTNPADVQATLPLDVVFAPDPASLLPPEEVMPGVAPLLLIVALGLFVQANRGRGRAGQ